jgi:subtilisin family serine protease
MNTVSSCVCYAARLVRWSSLNIALFTFCSTLFWTPFATADDSYSCAPSSTVFSMIGLVGVVEDLKKLSRREFGFLKMTPSKNPSLPEGTEINVLIDQACLVDSDRGPRAIEWLKSLRQRLGDGADGPRSFVWVLEKEWLFGDLQIAIQKEPCIQLASPNSSYQMMGLFNDPLIAKQEHLKALHFEDALATFIEPMLVRKRVTVAVIDSGVDFTHPDLHQARWINKGEVAGNGIDDEGNGYIDDINGYNFASAIGDASPQGSLPEAKHGTHVAGLAAARIDNGTGGAGINGVARVMSLNIFGSTNTTRSALLENALRYAADQGADVINMSLGGREYSRTMRAALDYAIAKGSFIVAAAGNYGFEVCDDPESFGFVSPAVYANAIDGA